MILATAPDKLETPALRDLLTRYRTALETDCTGVVSGCLGLRYFDLAANSASVVKLMAKLDRENAPRLLLMAVKLKSVDWDPELIELLLRHPPRQPDSARALMSSALQSASARIKDPGEARRFLDSIRAWEIVASPEWNLSGANADALFSLMAKARYLNKSDGRPEDSRRSDSRTGPVRTRAKTEAPDGQRSRGERGSGRALCRQDR
ncbi:MAG: hypothetical protein HC902_11500 [Calothrix sp. SM1_5_4]|nr:hypothetical protein [Calothrix sp. SM1_5_4]